MSRKIKENFSTVKEIMYHSLPEEIMQSSTLEDLITVKKNQNAGITQV